MDYKKTLYIIMEANYLKEMNRNIDDDNKDLFPFNWYLFDDYVLKTEILYEAIKNKKKIVNTKKYQLTLEGIKE